MVSVGVRELRQRASELLRMVERGEVIEITDRGRPVALLSPLPDESPLERLRAAGEVDLATEDLDDLPEPLVLPEGSESASTAVWRVAAMFSAYRWIHWTYWSRKIALATGWASG